MKGIIKKNSVTVSFIFLFFRNKIIKRQEFIGNSMACWRKQEKTIILSTLKIYVNLKPQIVNYMARG